MSESYAQLQLLLDRRGQLLTKPCELPCAAVRRRWLGYEQDDLVVTRRSLGYEQDDLVVVLLNPFNCRYEVTDADHLPDHDLHGAVPRRGLRLQHYTLAALGDGSSSNTKTERSESRNPIL